MQTQAHCRPSQRTILRAFVRVIHTANGGVCHARNTGLDAATWQTLLMLAIVCVLVYLAIVKGFEPLLLLDECERIIYLDFDIMLLRGIGELFELKGYCFAAHRGKSLLNPTLKGYEGEFKNARVYRSGIVVYYDNLPNPQECYEQIYRLSAHHGINDQGVLSLLILGAKFKTKELGYEYTGSTYWRKSIGYPIIHAWGKDGRFWNNELVYQFWGRIWSKYYQRWLECGGSDYKGGFICRANYCIERISGNSNIRSCRYFYY